jgi:hypothetical protein
MVGLVSNVRSGKVESCLRAVQHGNRHGGAIRKAQDYLLGLHLNVNTEQMLLG